MATSEAERGREHYTEYPLTKDPVDKTAAIVTAKSPKWTELNYKYAQRKRFFTCPKMRRNNNTVDLSGIRFGRLTVIGLSGNRKKLGGTSKGKGKARGTKYTRLWVVRCDCGVFEERITRTINRALSGIANRNDMCSHCQKINKLGGRP